MTETIDGFKCEHCGKWVEISEFIGTKNRNHCPYCLWSKHVDDEEAGDRTATCHGLMEPVGLTLKQAGQDKYGKDREGEPMIIHICQKCGKVSINRIAADDDERKILDLIDSEKINQAQKQKIEMSNISIIDKSKTDQIKTLLFGKH